MTPAVTPDPNLSTASPMQGPMPQAMQPDQGPPQLAQAQPGQGPSPSDIENYAAAVHHGRLANAINAVGDILGGSKTLRMVKNPDGSVDVQQVDATPGEKWGRVAAAALKGAATGFAVGQGPGGGARAFAASVPQGMAAPGEQRDKTLALAQQSNDQNQKRQLFNANMAKMHQEIVKATFDNMADPIKFSNEQAQANLTLHKQLNEMGAIPIADYDSQDSLATQFNSDPRIGQGHLGTNGVTHPIDKIKGNVVVGGQAYYLPEDKRDQLNDTAVDIPFTKVDENGKTTTTYMHVEPHMMTKGNILAAFANSQIQSNTASKQASEQTVAQQEAATKQETADTQRRTAAAQAGEAAAHANLYNAQAAVLPHPGAGGSINGPDGKQLTGEAYLQASGVDPSMWNQIRQGAAGEIKIAPPGSRNPQAMALRNAVLNYDPTYSDSRYTTVQDFKSKDSSTRLTNLSTALAHLEEANKHIGYVNPYSDEGTKYQQAIINFTNESGKYIVGNEVAKEKYDDLKAKMNSVVPSIRKSAVDEMTTLLGGRVRSQFEQFHRGTGMDIPVQSYFSNPETQARLQRYGVTQPPGGAPGPGPTPTPTPGPAGNTGQAAIQPGKIAVPPVPPNHTPQVNYVRGSDNKFYWIEPGNMAAAKQMDPHLQVIPR